MSELRCADINSASTDMYKGAAFAGTAVKDGTTHPHRQTTTPTHTNTPTSTH